MRTQIPLAVLAVAFACTFATAPAHARARVFVTSYGNDANPCTFGSPCKTFQQAVNVVDAGGEVTAIDSAGFGPLNITKAVTITSPPGIEASIAVPAGGTAVAIAAGANDIVTLRGLTLNGAGSGYYGIYLTAGGKLNVIDCFGTNYTLYGILVEPPAATATNTLVLISNTIVTDTPVAIELATYGTGGIQANFGGLTLDNNGGSIEVFAQGGPIDLTVSNSQIGHNNDSGIYSLGLVNHENWVSISLTNVAFGLMPIDISLNGSTLLSMSHVTQSMSPRPRGTGYYPGGEGILCAGTYDFIDSDGTNFLTSNIDPGCQFFQLKTY